MHIRPAQLSDLPHILSIYENARSFMAQNGNPGQWVNGYPSRAVLEDDIAQNRLFICEKTTSSKPFSCSGSETIPPIHISKMAAGKMTSPTVPSTVSPLPDGSRSLRIPASTGVQHSALFKMHPCAATPIRTICRCRTYLPATAFCAAVSFTPKTARRASHSSAADFIHNYF